MILSYRNNFTFVHCPKTGGSSVAVWLSRFLGPFDLQIGSWEDIYAASGNANLKLYLDAFGPARAASTLTSLARRDKPVISALSWSQKKKYRKRLGPQPAHASASAVKRFDPQRWERNFTFCFVRNPYSRLYSYYNWVQGYRQTPQSFLEFLVELEGAKDGPGRFADTWEFYTENNRVIVDFIGRFENLRKDMAHVADRLGLPFDAGSFPHAKPGQSGKRYQDAYGPQERAIADRLGARECDYFGYEF